MLEEFQMATCGSLSFVKFRHLTTKQTFDAFAIFGWSCNISFVQQIFQFSCVPGMLSNFFGALLGILLVPETALAVLPEVVDPEIPRAVDSVAFSDTVFTDAILNVVTQINYRGYSAS